MKYYVVASDGFEQMTKRVNELIQKGWEPLGGITVNSAFTQVYYYQSMIYKKDDISL